MEPDLVNSLLGSLCSPCIIDACVSTDPSDPLLTDNEIALLTQASAPISSTAKPSSQHFKHYDWVPVCTELEPIEAETFIKSNDYKTTCSHSNRKACNLHPHSDKLLLHTITARLPNVFEMLITKLE